jgi:dTDP-4-dehydrorhamnose reductase
MRILITGGSGQLGRSLVLALDGHDVAALSHSELDVADAASVAAAIERVRPAVVVHAAALTDTARCEAEPDLARIVNAGGAENVARACARAGARLLALSTNEVFDGEGSTPYAEGDVTRPLNAYAQSKLEGERLAATANPATLIVRTSWLYGAGGNNFVEKVLAAARSGRRLSFVTDEVASPTSTPDLAQALRALIERDARPGIYHLVNEGAASRFEWAIEVLRLAGIDTRIDAVTTAELRARGYAGPRKPAYSVLANTRAAVLGVRLRPWRDALAEYMARERVAADG